MRSARRAPRRSGACCCPSIRPSIASGVVLGHGPDHRRHRDHHDPAGRDAEHRTGRRHAGLRHAARHGLDADQLRLHQLTRRARATLTQKAYAAAFVLLMIVLGAQRTRHPPDGREPIGLPFTGGARAHLTLPAVRGDPRGPADAPAGAADRPRARPARRPPTREPQRRAADVSRRRRDKARGAPGHPSARTCASGC